MNDSALTRFFGVVARPQTWLGILFQWLAFPLGLFYFVFLTTGLSLGIGLVVIWVGVPILLVVAGAWWLFGAFERVQARYLLGAEVPPAPREWEKAEGVWAKLKAHFGSGATWKDLLYLLAKLAFGIVSFTLLVTAVSMVFWFMAIPGGRDPRRADRQRHLGAAAVVRRDLGAAGHPRVLRVAARAQWVELGMRTLGRGDVPRLAAAAPARDDRAGDGRPAGRRPGAAAGPGRSRAAGASRDSGSAAATRRAAGAAGARRRPDT